jgi:hypothetical protein
LQKYTQVITFDIESYQDKLGINIPVLICAVIKCVTCYTDGDRDNCDSCSKTHFWSCDKFCKWIFSLQVTTLVFAHNFSKFDGIFIQKFLQKNSKFVKATTIVNGTKVLCIKSKFITMLDSLSFIPLPLAKFDKTFGINAKKGIFPFKFISPQNLEYVGPYPDPSFYGIENFTDQKLIEFHDWYSSVKNDIFDFKAEILKYCYDDCEILMKGVICFKEIIEVETQTDKLKGVHPYSDVISLAGLCSHIYRRNVLKPKTISYEPEYGHKKYSRKCINWLNSLMIKDDTVKIRHARNGGEVKIDKYFVDGYDKDTDTIYQFDGCWYHSCPRCIKDRNIFNSFFQDTAANVYKKHLEKKNYLIGKCTNYVDIWECDYDKMPDKIDEEVSLGLSVRAAIFGGRTNAIKLHHKVSADEKIHWLDFKSLYPFCQKVCKFPVGKPVYKTENFDNVDIKQIFGLITLQLLPPRGLFLPVIPKKINNKLNFPLCRTCTEQSNQDRCTHTDKERMITGTWVTPEIHKAVELGYIVVKILDIVHYSQSETYDPITKTGGIFTEYVNLFVKGKQEASGFPPGCTTLEQKQNYVEDFYQNEGIRLDIDKIKFNAGKRYVMKLLCNSQVMFLSKI